MHFFRFLLLALAVSPLTIAGAASYDCEKAATNVELAICGDDTLSAADTEMAALYLEARQKDAMLSSAQSTWLHTVRDVCEDIECLSRVYSERIATLEATLRTQPKLADAEKAKALQSPELPSKNVQFAVSERPEQASPSFDCKSAASSVELLICNDDNLSIADREVFKQVSVIAITRPQVAHDQALWISATRDKCIDSKCLSSAYLARLNELEEVARTPPVESPNTHGGCRVASSQLLLNSVVASADLLPAWPV